MSNNRRIRKTMRERLNPSIFKWDFLALNPILLRLRKFSDLLRSGPVEKMLDLGCGVKPYESLFPFVGEFTGFDVERNDRVDVVGLNWDLPFRDDEFDALISTQVFEHTAKTTETAKEVRRVVKNGGLVFVSVPFVYPIHGAPYDYYRFTKYGLLEVFKDFELVALTPSGGYINTQLRLVNVFLRHLPFSEYWLFPVFFLNNVLALTSDIFFKWFLGLFGARGRSVYENLYMGMPENYTLILKNRK